MFACVKKMTNMRYGYDDYNDHDHDLDGDDDDEDEDADNNP